MERIVFYRERVASTYQRPKLDRDRLEERAAAMGADAINAIEDPVIRVFLRLRFLRGMSWKEVADTCGKTGAAVRDACLRYLYQTGAGFRCRKRAGLSYKCQRDSMYYYRKGMAYAQKHLRPEFYPLWRDDFCDWTPPPRYMHQTAYQRRLAKLLQYQEKYREKRLEPWQRLAALLGGKS